MDPRSNRREYVKVLLRVRPPLLSAVAAVEEDQAAQQGVESTNEEVIKHSTTVVDDQVVKLAPVRVERLRFGLTKMLETYGDDNEKLDKVFKFDRVFGEGSSQNDIFAMVTDSISPVLDGFVTTLLSYGPTFGGKSFTMVGTEKEPGLIPRSIELLFHLLEEKKAANADAKIITEVEVSYVELFNKTFRNLLKVEVAPPPTPSKMTIAVETELDDVLNPFSARDERIDIHETPALGVFMVGAGLRVPVHSAEETFSLVRKGEGQRLGKASSSSDGSARFDCHRFLLFQMLTVCAFQESRDHHIVCGIQGPRGCRDWSGRWSPNLRASADGQTTPD